MAMSFFILHALEYIHIHVHASMLETIEEGGKAFYGSFIPISPRDHQMSQFKPRIPIFAVLGRDLFSFNDQIFNERKKGWEGSGESCVQKDGLKVTRFFYILMASVTTQSCPSFLSL